MWKCHKTYISRKRKGLLWKVYSSCLVRKRPDCDPLKTHILEYKKKYCSTDEVKACHWEAGTQPSDRLSCALVTRFTDMAGRTSLGNSLDVFICIRDVWFFFPGTSVGLLLSSRSLNVIAYSLGKKEKIRWCTSEFFSTAIGRAGSSIDQCFVQLCGLF